MQIQRMYYLGFISSNFSIYIYVSMSVTYQARCQISLRGEQHCLEIAGARARHAVEALRHAANLQKKKKN